MHSRSLNALSDTARRELVLTGRHGFFATYEAFGRVVDSMLTQHMKWLRKAKEQAWRPYQLMPSQHNQGLYQLIS